MRFLPSRPTRASARNICRSLCCLLCGALFLAATAASAVAQSAISYRSSETADTGAGASSITVNKPAGTVTNDVMIANLFVRGLGTTPSVTAPAGWTLIREDFNANSMLSYYRVAGASEPANYTWTFDSSRPAVAVISSYSGVSTSAPVDAHSGQMNLPSTTITAPSVTTTVANTMLVGCFGLLEGGQNISPAAGMTERVDISPAGPNLTLEMSDELRAASGATGQRDATASFSDTSFGQLLTLRPAGAPVNNPPTVNIESPDNNETFTAPANITIAATADDSDGPISQVEFFQGTTSLFVDTIPPYSYEWTGVGAGSYTLTAKATDNAGVTTTSAPVNVTVNSPAGGGWIDTGATVVLTDASDRVGVGTNSPLTKLHVAGGTRVDGTSGRIYVGTGAVQNYRGLEIVEENATTFSIRHHDPGVAWRNIAINPLGGNVGIGNLAPNAQYKLDVNGHTNVTGNFNTTGTITGGIIEAKYQDVAEWVESSQDLSAGTVVVLDHTKSNQVIASTHAYDTRVAGVISAQPGIVLGERGENKVLVATTGRVRIKVDATRAPIQVGDLLVTGDRAGFAMKSLPVSIGGVQLHRPGTLVGKALEPLAKGTGEILVLLSLQ